jgi:cobalt/nickel transport system permease protein
MHLAEGTLPLSHAAVGWALALPAVAWSLRGIGQGPTPGLLPASTALLFAATLLPLPVPVLGATSHICLTPLLGLLLGTRAVVWPTFFVLALQAVFFAHGGLTTLGVNVLTLGLLAPIVATTTWNTLRAARAPFWLALGSACALADLAVYVADAAVLAVALADAAPPQATFLAVVLGFAPVQLPLAVLEGATSVALVRMLAQRRPRLLPTWAVHAAEEPIPWKPAARAVVMAVGLGGCGYEGIDGSVFGVVAEQAGRAPRPSAIDASDGELGLAMGLLIPFVFGVAAGRAWERSREGDDAPSR